MVQTVLTGSVDAVEGYLVAAEVDIAEGLPCIDMVGNLGHEVKESAERVRVSLKNTGISVPPKRVTVNLSPAGIKKGGTVFDLPIALGIMAAIGMINLPTRRDWIALGELGLEGDVKAVSGILPILVKAKEEGIKTCILPFENCAEAEYISGISMIPVRLLSDCISLFSDKEHAQKQLNAKGKKCSLKGKKLKDVEIFERDFADIIGQPAAKRAAEIAAAGFHNLLLSGPPGTGKSMLASAIPGILPPMEEEEMLETSKVYSVAGLLNDKQPYIRLRPYQSPHHTITPQALVGGGFNPSPGIISLANHGVLFLDELPEFKRQTLDLLRQPLEEGRILIQRKSGNYLYPCHFMLVAAMNPCPCGYYPDRKYCSCTEREVHNYRKHISGPLLNRLDLSVTVLRNSYQEIRQKQAEESSESIRKRVVAARELQRERNGKKAFNSMISAKDIDVVCRMSEDARKLTERYYSTKNLSMRGYHRMLRVARTIADLEKEEEIKEAHILEAASYRGLLDR